MNGGIYDQVGGGFARYSVDADWEIPHFEKMLYDNAQLVSLYSEAYQVTHNERYKEVVDQTYEFIERELSDSSGGFYSALDADSEGEEGKFYVWTYEELKAILGSDFEAFLKVYDISVHGNFEGKNNLVRRPNVTVGASQIDSWRKKLLNERSKRVRPRLDDKILTSWNALMLSGYLDAYKAFGEQRFLDRALKCAAFIKSRMLEPDFKLKRNFKNGQTTISGFLDDYSFTCEAFIGLYQVTFDEQWLLLAREIADYTIQHFSNAANGLFFYTSISDDPLIARKTESSDNVVPASNSSMALALYRLGVMLDNKGYIQQSKRALNNIKDNMLGYPTYYANWAILMDWFIHEPYEVAICGEHALQLNGELNTCFLPNCIVLGKTSSSNLLLEIPLIDDKLKPGETWIYVCQDKTCGIPVKTVDQALGQIR